MSDIHPIGGSGHETDAAAALEVALGRDAAERIRSGAADRRRALADLERDIEAAADPDRIALLLRAHDWLERLGG